MDVQTLKAYLMLAERDLSYSFKLNHDQPLIHFEHVRDIFDSTSDDQKYHLLRTMLSDDKG